MCWIILHIFKFQTVKTPLRTIQNGYYTYKGRTLYTDGNNLINYNTTIATLKDGKVYLNIKTEN